ncbi:MAG: sulfatase-like hydrolase/transferase [Myxococcales bacterium]|nr:sulfatase-like hydrolase/transferase [Myxococcales bacterium]
MRRLVFVVAAAALVVFFGALTFSSGPSVEVLPSVKRTSFEVTASELQRHARVILVTLDGARWQDVLDQPGALRSASAPPAMPKTLELVRQNGVALAARTSSAIPLSLPGYQALATGRQTPCTDNDCERVALETVAEALARRLPAGSNTAAVFASWAQLAFAATAREGAVLVDAPPRGPAHPGGPPWEDARWDTETADRALAFWRTERPRFIHLALLDMDEFAHRRDVAGTLAALHAADDVISRLVDEVKALPENERRLTTVLVTADHGRGPGRLWPAHGAYAASRDIFLLAIGDAVAGGEQPVEQVDVKPTIERLFGLSAGVGEGHAIEAIVGSLPAS